MHNPKMIENEKDLHCYMKHELPVYMVVLDPKLQQHQRLLCQKCLESFESGFKMIGFKKIIKIIQERRDYILEILKNVIQNNIQLVKQFQNHIITLKQQLTQQLDKLLEDTSGWILNLQFKVQKYMEYSFFKELDSLTMNQYLMQNEQINLSNQIEILNECWSRKINQKFELFQQFVEYQKCQEILKNIMESSQLQLNIKSNPIFEQSEDEDYIEQTKVIKQIEIQQQQDPTQLQFIDSIEQHEECRAIVFDPIGKTMISTIQNDIKVWNFQNGRIQLNQVLQGHQKYVNCLLHSQINNCFISGSRDKSIRLWKQFNNNLWQSSKPYVEHQDYIYCMILTQKEDQLFSGSGDKSIKIWKVDYNDNTLQFQHTLEKHNDRIFSLSLNDSESVLVSCEQRLIIIWQKKESDFWSFQQVVKQEYGSHVKFLKDDYFIWLPERSNQLCVFENNDGSYKENISKRVNLFEKDENKNVINFQYFPIMYNKDQNLICLRHIYHIFILKLDNFGQIFKVMSLNCQHWSTYGTISNNWQYLIFWGDLIKKYEIYEILYT